MPSTVSDRKKEPEEKSNLRRVGENFVSVSVMSIVVRLLGMISGIYVRRILGPVGMGQVNWTAAVSSYFGVLINPGVERVAQRDVAQDNDKSTYYASAIFTFELILASVALGLMGIIYCFNLRGAVVNQLLLIQGIGLLLTPLHPAWLFYARQRAIPVAAAEIVMQVIQVAAIFLFVYEPSHVFRYVLLSYPIRLASIIFLIWYAARFKLFDIKKFRLTLQGMGKLFKEAAPIGLTAVSSVIFYNSDSIMLGFMHGDVAVGIYTTAYNLMLVPTFLNGGLITSYFPVLAKAYGDDERCRHSSAEYFKLHCWMGIPVAALGWIAGSEVLPFLYGEKFAASGPLFQWLCINLALIFIHSGLTMPLNAWKKQATLCKITLSAAAANIALNFLLIPTYGAKAAVITTILAEIIIIGSVLVVRRNLHPIPAWRIMGPPLFLSLGVVAITQLVGFLAGGTWWSIAGLGCILMATGLVIMQRQMIDMVFSKLRRKRPV